jgi:hypothetical protein
MKKAKEGKVVALAVAILCLLMVGSSGAEEKKKKKDSRTADRIEATATSTGTQVGQMISVTIIVYEYSPPEDQKILLDAFESGGQEGLTNALSKMSAKGRIAVTGTLGYDLNYIRQWPTDDGRRIRFATDRPIRFGEAWAGGRSTEYSLSGGEIDLSKDKKKSTGTLLPACKFKIGKDNHLEIEALQNPWRLVNIYED